VRKRQIVLVVLIILVAICIGWFIQSANTSKQDAVTVAPTQSTKPSDKPSESATPAPEQSSESPSASPTPKQTLVAPTEKPSKTKAPITPAATPSSKVKLSPSPSSTNLYPRMRGNVVPQNFTNTPYTAGKDIPVGLYHSVNSVCGYQIRMVDKSLFNVSVYEKGSTQVEIRAGEQLLNSDCSITFGPPTFQDVLLPGTHLVGLDIEPGIYHAEYNLSCRFALASRAVLTRGNERVKVGFGNLNGVRDMLIPADAEAVLFASECGVLTKVG
jgi:hypothetical protein